MGQTHSEKWGLPHREVEHAALRLHRCSPCFAATTSLALLHNGCSPNGLNAGSSKRKRKLREGRRRLLQYGLSKRKYKNEIQKGSTKRWLFHVYLPWFELVSITKEMLESPNRQWWVDAFSGPGPAADQIKAFFPD